MLSIEHYGQLNGCRVIADVFICIWYEQHDPLPLLFLLPVRVSL